MSFKLGQHTEIQIASTTQALQKWDTSERTKSVIGTKLGFYVPLIKIWSVEVDPKVCKTLQT